MNWLRSISGFHPAALGVQRPDAAFTVSARLRTCAIFFAAIATLLALSLTASAQTIPGNVGKSSAGLPLALLNVGFEPPLNGQIPLDLPFRDETGNEVHLRQYFAQQKPVLLALVYYTCPML